MAPPPIVSKPVKKKRPAATAITSGTTKQQQGAKKIRLGNGVAVRPTPIQSSFNNNNNTDAGTTTETGGKNNNNTSSSSDSIKERFLRLLESRKDGVVSNTDLKEIFGEKDFILLPPVINELTASSRLTMSKNNVTNELFYQLVSLELAKQFNGLDVSAKMVYQVIERAGNMGIWTKDIRMQTNIQQQALNKIFKQLENRQLIKPVKSVTAKSKKLYMLYNLTPSTELTGGVWYSDLEFDHEFINELRNFLLQCVRRLNGGKGVTLNEILEKMQQHKVSKVDLSTTEVLQLANTLVYDYMVETAGENERGETLYVAARRVTPMCDFSWWDVIETDFHYRNIRFEDGVELSAHEPHHQTS